MAYEGSCHCGAVRFTVQGDMPGEAISCNCSHCRRKGFLLSAVPGDKFTLDAGKEWLTEYRFHTKRIAHKFCNSCGCQGFAEGKNQEGEPMYMVNLRCVPDCDLDKLKISAFDGASR